MSSSYINHFTQPDTVIPDLANPQAWNRYSYGLNNPVRYNDPTGHWFETALDIAFIAYDIYDISKNGLNWENGLSLTADVAGAVLPFVTGGGVAVRAAMHADDVVDAVKTADKIVDTSKASDKLKDFANIIGDVCSFSADTVIATQEGEKSISAIEVGDYVLAWNDADGTIGFYEVTDTFSHADRILTEIIIDGEWIETTPEHPFYTEEEGWLSADELKPGMHIRQADGDYELVWLKWNIHQTQEMYNLTVDEAHTYFVGKGQWLVHNDCWDVWNRIEDGDEIPVNEILELGQEFVGDDAVKVSSGIYVSSLPVPGTENAHSMFRITDADIAGHGMQPHANFEIVEKISSYTGRTRYTGIPGYNKHVRFLIE